MSQSSTKNNFLEQFDEAKVHVKTWPDWMQSSARTASASFPKSMPNLRSLIDKRPSASSSIARKK